MRFSPTNKYVLKIKNRNTENWNKICSKLIKLTLESAFINNFERISTLFMNLQPEYLNMH